ncbi:hypothetical protein KFE25_002992 [Diacronema lutheri]|nr:hypothetical protein KFE25_002992 [Diacronema lutheri]
MMLRTKVSIAPSTAPRGHLVITLTPAHHGRPPAAPALGPLRCDDLLAEMAPLDLGDTFAARGNLPQAPKLQPTGFHLDMDALNLPPAVGWTRAPSPALFRLGRGFGMGHHTTSLGPHATPLDRRPANSAAVRRALIAALRTVSSPCTPAMSAIGRHRDLSHAGTGD